MKQPLSRKIIGTVALGAVLSLGLFGTAKATEAFFLGAGRTLIFDAVVGSADADSVTVYTTSSEPIELQVNSRTSGNVEADELDAGDNVKVIAVRQGGALVARVINRASGVGGYGTAGDFVLVSRGTVVAKTADTITVRVNGANVTFHITGSTRFFGTSFASLQTGQRILVMGEDTGSSATGFVARNIFR